MNSAASQPLPPPKDPAQAAAFLEQARRATYHRGEQYFRGAAVKALTCSEPGTLYRTRVQGGALYNVELVYEDGAWFSACSCPVVVDCKHGVAAMLALLDRTGTGRVPVAAAAPAAPVPSLEEAVAAAWPRKLTPDERRFLDGVSELHQRSRWSAGLERFRIQKLFPNLRIKHADLRDLWPQYPAQETEFWQYLAYLVHTAGEEVPAFLRPITRVEETARRVAAYRRDKEVAQWRQQLDGQTHARPAGRAPLELRWLVKSSQLVVEWRLDETAPFRPLKASRLLQLLAEHTAGSLTILPAVYPLWQAVQTAQQLAGASEFPLTTLRTRQMLGALLRLPQLHDRILTAGGQPFVHSLEPLHWELIPATQEHEDYRLRLCLPDGRPPEPLLVALPGQPTWYVGNTTVYPGPPAWEGPGAEGTRSGTGDQSAGNRTELRIPAPALETAAGAKLLAKLQLELPPRLAARVQRVRLRVRIQCDLQAPATGSKTEYVTFQIATANDPAGPGERYTVAGWQLDWERQPRRGLPPAANPELLLLDRTALDELPAQLAPLGLGWDSQAQRWRLRVSKDFAETFTAWLATLPSDIEVVLDRELATLRDPAVAANVRLDCTPSGIDWFDLRVVLDVADTKLTPAELQALLAARGGYVRLGEKGWRRLQFNLSAADDEQLARLGLDARDFSAEPQRLHAFQLADDAAARFLPAARVAEVRRRASELQARVTPPVPAAVRGQLRPYQVDGFHFLAYLTANRFGGVLADDMGLGKTLQTLAWLAWLRESGAAHRPSLVVCPKSVMDNWQAEAVKFLPNLRVHLWRGAARDTLSATAAGTDLLVVNYTQLRGLAAELPRVQWLAAILDEGQYIKNPASQTARVALGLPADHRLVLTGTPIENRLLDLWSLLAYAMPGVLGNRAQFTKRFDQQTDPLARRRLAARVRPFVLRRTKAQVAPELPDRVEEDLFCEMEDHQRTLYRAELKRAQQMLFKIKTRKELDLQRFNFLTSLLRLRQICCDVRLVDPKHAAAPGAKLTSLLELLEPLLAEGHKVLVFSQFVRMLTLIEPLLRERHWPYFKLIGATENRGALVAQFQQARGGAVFLVSLKAGGFGLNLTAASYVVLFDPWWNPGSRTRRSTAPIVSARPATSWPIAS